ncbi:MAG: YihY/virulence factor BrkB family protein [Bacteroidetes bacterium]|nr:YihY/virulence factor BrkB family protein [Bacteroidota bacterium]
MKQALKRYLISIKPWAKKVSFPGFFKVPIWDVITFSLKEFQRFDLMIRANAVSFSFFLALFPSLIALFTLTPFLKEYILGFLPGNYHFDAYLQEEIQKIMPGNAGDRLFNFIEDITSQPRIGLFSFGFLSAIFFASNGILALIRGFEKDEMPNFLQWNMFKKRMNAMLLTLIIGGLVIVSVLLVILGSWFTALIIQFIKVGKLFAFLLNLSRWLIIISLFYSSISLIYKFGAATKKRFRFFTPGSALATLLCLGSSIIFSYYVDQFNTYNELYGSIGTIIVLMLWIQLNTLSILIGFELNAGILINMATKEKYMIQPVQNIHNSQKN